MDFFGINGWEFMVLLLLATFIFGPDRLPKAISDGVKMLRNLRDMARNATTDLSRELGTDISLEDLNPKSLIRKHLLSEEDERAIRRPFEDLYQDVRGDITGLHTDIRGGLRGVQSEVRGAQQEIKQNLKPTLNPAVKPVSANAPQSVPTQSLAAAQAWDDDAT